MKVTKDQLSLLLEDDAGQDVIEYALLAALLALATFAAMHNFGRKLNREYRMIGKRF